MCNVHLCTLPKLDRKTCQVISELRSKLLDVLCLTLRLKLLSVSSKNACNTTGRLKSVLISPQVVIDEHFTLVRVWSSLPQLDLVKEDVMNCDALSVSWWRQ